ncbi:hypothetical protein B1Q45_18740 [Salmonella enterica]|uniref:Uncharacterized protein n=3 Tax=Salmonella enterica TaxID=28901 RepID=A0A6C8ME21_SALER|nr:hypothetical protein [Salmonella enterica]EBV8904597.1 hypothetical protein [Salmonella enterica subsp. arizonae serovar 18:z4,z23:-]EBV9432753.1 hypothetical protein [Salmonella enterica subsp. enterica serovar Heidelberg]ECC3428521.1 hypothetical protein [Salmonella enterica subsp. arizonae]ECU0366914.1 hypothetical protein [Salmonella enterica subsp. enterica serovar Newport]ECU7350876.1 hypothetical protein [Salmonella enterica subsp. enterica serovar Kentucky]EDB5611661.1 hypothetical
MSNGKTKTQAERLFDVNFDATGITVLSIDWRWIDKCLCDVNGCCIKSYPCRYLSTKDTSTVLPP